MINEFERMQKLAGIDEMRINKPGVRIYYGEPNSELFKIENFPIMSNTQDIFFPEDDREAIENLPEMAEMLKNKTFKYILDKVAEYVGMPINEYFREIEFRGDFSSPNKLVYIYIAGDGAMYIANSLDYFFSKNEEDWGIKNWVRI